MMIRARRGLRLTVLGACLWSCSHDGVSPTAHLPTCVFDTNDGGLSSVPPSAVNACTYTVTSSGSPIASGTCDSYSFARDGSDLPSGASLSLSSHQATSTTAMNLGEFGFSYDPADAALHWPALVGKSFHWSLGGSSSSQRALDAILDYESSPVSLFFDCFIDGIDPDESTMRSFDITFTSATAVCKDATSAYYVVHGTADLECVGMLNEQPVDLQTQITF